MLRPLEIHNILGVVLAGGQSRRMEGPEKSLMALQQKPIIEHVAERLFNQVEQVIINANGDASRFKFLDIPVENDSVKGFVGPLAGILAGMERGAKDRHTSHILTVAADSPFFPEDLLEKFLADYDNQPDTQKQDTVCMAYSAGNRHPTFGLWPIHLADQLRDFLIVENQRKVLLFAQRFNLVKTDFVPIDSDIDPFFNINTPEDFERANTYLERKNP